MNPSFSGNKRLIVGLVILVLLVGGGYLALQHSGFLDSLRLANQIQQQKKQDADDAQVLAQLGKILVLPDGQPTMAIITDIDALKQQQPDFFAQAKNGDHLIIYPKTAIIYDFEANKIIKVGLVQQTATPDASAPTQK